MKVGPRLRVVPVAVGMVLVAFGVLVVLLKANSSPPKTAIEAFFAQVIDEANISDHFDWDGDGGWDSEDVTGKVCHRVDVAGLQKLGMSKTAVWPTPAPGEMSRAIFVWRMTEDKSWQAACRDHSIRELRIEIDAETLACRAIVMPFPTCDM